jgi:hypothetical protein
VLIQRGQAIPAVHHQADQIRFSRRDPGLIQNILLKTPDAFRTFLHLGVAVQGHAAGVHQRKRLLASALDHAFHPVAGYARPVMGNGPVAADQPVEQRGLAHIGSAEQRDFFSHIIGPQT